MVVVCDRGSADFSEAVGSDSWFCSACRRCLWFAVEATWVLVVLFRSLPILGDSGDRIL